MAVNLTKGQKISLEKESGTKLNSVVMGLGWDAVKKIRRIFEWIAGWGSKRSGFGCIMFFI